MQYIHSWEGGQCQFHALKVCSCGKCPNKNEPKCDGKDYHSREVLSCPFHLLVYKIECSVRAQMADKLVHKKLLRGHSNWLESSHNVFIRFRPKHIFLERLHYHVSTNLGLLQANMTHEYNQQGPAYHWKVELLQRLQLPVYEGVQRTLETVNRRRKEALDSYKTTKAKKRRVELKTIRTKDAQERKLWTKKHGQDTYGDDDEAEVDREEKVKPTQKEEGKKEKKPCKCGSMTHSKANHKDCPLNKKNNVREGQSTQSANNATPPERDDAQDQASADNVFHHQDEPIRIGSSSDDEANSEAENECTSLDDGLEPEAFDEVVISSDGDGDIDPEAFEDMVIAGCNCGALNKAHKKSCPMNSRMRYTNPKRERNPHLKAGDYVYLHSAMLKDMHLCCRIAEYMPGRIASLYRVVCPTGVLRDMHPETALTSRQSTTPISISLNKWRTGPKISLKAVCNDPKNLETCECKEVTVSKDSVDLTNAPSSPSSAQVWVKTPLYILHESDCDLITSEAGWLNDNIITASQKLLQQQFPNISGLQPPTLELLRGFQQHTGRFAQVVNVKNSHWIFVSNLGCCENEVCVYDTMYPSIPSSTVDTIARLSFSSSSPLTIKMADVHLQTNSSNCGVLSVAIAYDVLSENGLSIARYDPTRIREHLRECLTSCCLTPFPVLSRNPQEDIKFKSTFEVPLFCVCRMPENEEDNWAECEKCGEWFHKHCLDIPEEVFDENIKASWQCRECEQMLRVQSPS